MSEWISVEDRLPTKYGRYLIRYTQGRTMQTFVADWDYPEEGGRWANVWPEMTVTYWQPLPPPPEENSK